MTPLTGRQQKSIWRRHFVYRHESLKTTWKFRLVLLVLGILVMAWTRGFWINRIGQSLVCPESMVHSDAILIENFDPNYLLFERAAALHQAGWAPRVFVHLPAPPHPTQPGLVAQGIAEVMARVARLQGLEMISVGETEPISLNVAMQIRDFLHNEQVRSVLVVTSGFRSMRSSLIYQTVLAPGGITVSCVPVFGAQTPQTWTQTWHGIQNVAEQFLKLQYYRFYVLLEVF